MIESLPAELMLLIFQFLDIPKVKQIGKVKNDRVIFKSYSSLRLVSTNFYLAENTSRCKFCSGRYNYFKKNVTKCYCCGHVINSKNFKTNFKEVLFNNRIKILGIRGLNHRLLCQYQTTKNKKLPVSNCCELYSNSRTANEEKQLYYTVIFHERPMSLIVEQNDNDQVKVCGFAQDSSCKLANEISHRQIKSGDTIVAINNINIKQIGFDKACDLIHAASWPREIEFMRHNKNSTNYNTQLMAYYMN